MRFHCSPKRPFVISNAVLSVDAFESASTGVQCATTLRRRDLSVARRSAVVILVWHDAPPS